MRITVALVFFAVAITGQNSNGFDFVRYDDAEGAFSVSLPSDYVVTKSDGGRAFDWTNEYMGQFFVSVSWADGTNLTVNEVKQAYESYLGVESALGAWKTIIPYELLATYVADDGLRGQYDIDGENEVMRYRVSFLKRRDRVYTFVIATPVALEEGFLDVVETVQNSIILQGGN
jgi:hypothetical protein